MPHPLRNILNGLIWTGRADECLIAYVHRGAEGDLATIRASEIAEVGKSWFALRDGSIIPFHRVAWIRRSDGGLIWEGRGKAQVGSDASGRSHRRPARRASPSPP